MPPAAKSILKNNNGANNLTVLKQHQTSKQKSLSVKEPRASAIKAAYKISEMFLKSTPQVADKITKANVKKFPITIKNAKNLNDEERLKSLVEEELKEQIFVGPSGDNKMHDKKTKAKKN